MNSKWYLDYLQFGVFCSIAMLPEYELLQLTVEMSLLCAQYSAKNIIYISISFSHLFCSTLLPKKNQTFRKYYKFVIFYYLFRNVHVSLPNTYLFNYKEMVKFSVICFINKNTHLIPLRCMPISVFKEV